MNYMKTNFFFLSEILHGFHKSVYVMPHRCKGNPIGLIDKVILQRNDT